VNNRKNVNPENNFTAIDYGCNTENRKLRKVEAQSRLQYRAKKIQIRAGAQSTYLKKAEGRNPVY